MRRRWIVRIRNENDAGGTVMVSDEASSRFTEAITELSKRIDGDLAFALVPTEELADTLKALEFSSPVHLVVPRESAGVSDAPGGFWKTRFAKIASTNVQPGRGDTQEDWDDCEAWLDSITEIDLVFNRARDIDSEEPDGKSSRRPEMLFFTDFENYSFSGFGVGSLKVDPRFNRVANDVFGKLPIPDDLEEVKGRASDVAGRCAPWFRFLETGSLFLNISPSIILAMGAFGLATTPRAIWKFSAALLATLAALGLKKVRSRRCWLSSRALAEICRSIKHSGEILDPLFPPAANHLTNHASLARSLAISMMERSHGNLPQVLEIRDRYLARRLGGKNGQIEYYTGQAERAQNRRSWVKRVFQIATSCALLSTVFALIVLLDWFPAAKEFSEVWVSGFATFAFPALAAAAIGYLGLSETTRRADYYSEMERMLKKQEEILSALKSESSIKEAIRNTESILLEEFAGWLRRRVY